MKLVMEYIENRKIVNLNNYIIAHVSQIIKKTLS
jgi:hypothetical protein